MDDYWKKCNTIRRYMPEAEGISVDDIIRELHKVKELGYQAIQITAPYKSAGFRPWWGLRPLDYFQINQFLGKNMDDFKRFVCACHSYNMKILVFLNLGYADVHSDLWKRACTQQRFDRNGVERQYFLWSKTGTEYVQKEDSHFIQWEVSGNGVRKRKRIIGVIGNKMDMQSHNIIGRMFIGRNMQKKFYITG